MPLLNPISLAQTVDAVNEAVMFGRTIPAAERRALAQWIADRRGLPGSYAGTFALFPHEARQGVRLFTGERVTNAGARHIFGQEACRALRLMNVRDRRVTAALEAATANLAQCIGPVRPAGDSSHWWEPYLGGVYCCGRCSVGYWRHVTAGGFDDHERRLAAGLRCLKDRRKENAQWRTFPFWYTLSALIEIELPAAVAEIRHVAPQLERAAKRPPRDDAYAQRRHELAKRALARL